MKRRHLVSLAMVAAPAFVLGACSGGGAGAGNNTGAAGNIDVVTGGAGSGDTSGAAGNSGMTGAGTGTSGTTGSGTGTAGTGAASVDCSMDTGTTDDTISDFEDGSGSVLPNEGRNGGWYAYVDTAATCMVTPAPNGSAGAEAIPGGRCQSMFGMHFYGMGCTDFGAGVGTDLAAPASADGGTGPKVPYDVTMFKGISFWSRADKGSSMRFKMPMTDETKTTDGGSCVDSTTAKCSDDFGANIALTKSWVKHTIMFSTMKQEGWGKTFTWNPAHVTSIQFQVPKTTPFDLWIDDVSFVK